MRLSIHASPNLLIILLISRRGHLTTAKWISNASIGGYYLESITTLILNISFSMLMLEQDEILHQIFPL